MLIHTVELPDGTAIERKSASRTYSHVVAVRMNDSELWRIRNWWHRVYDACEEAYDRWADARKALDDASAALAKARHESLSDEEE